jgi:hypothetical protein
MAKITGWFGAIERWGTQSDRNSWLVVAGLVGIFVAILAVAAALAAIYLLPPGTLSLW